MPPAGAGAGGMASTGAALAPPLRRDAPPRAAAARGGAMLEIASPKLRNMSMARSTDLHTRSVKQQHGLRARARGAHPSASASSVSTSNTSAAVAASMPMLDST
jgi:hypothetical protein